MANVFPLLFEKSIKTINVAQGWEHLLHIHNMGVGLRAFLPPPHTPMHKLYLPGGLIMLADILTSKEVEGGMWEDMHKGALKWEERKILVCEVNK